MKSIRLLEEILKKFFRKKILKMSIGFKCRGPKVEPRFCSFLGCVHFSTTGTDKENNKTFYVSRRKYDAYYTEISLV